MNVKNTTLNTREDLQEGWVKFTRFYFKEGHIDRWIGDSINDPNQSSGFKKKGRTGVKVRYYRLIDKPWEPDEYFGRKISMSLINNELRNTHVASEVYSEHFHGAYEQPLIIKKASCNVLDIKDIQAIVNNSFTNKDMVEKLNNLLTTKEIQVVDSVMEMLDSRCDSYSRIVRKLTEMRGDAVMRQNADFGQTNC